MVLKELLIDKWGKNTVVPISNYNTLQLRSLIKDISKFYGLDFSEVNKVTGVMLKEATPIAKKAHGVTAGVQQTPWSEGQNVRHLEPLGFIKFDILGLASLRMLEGAIRHILRRHEGMEEPTFQDVKDWYDRHLDPNVLDLDDQKVYKNVFQKGKWAGVFQFTEKGAQGFCKKARPTSIIDISAVTSIYRPGPLSAKVHDHYVAAKRNPKGIYWRYREIAMTM